METGSIVDTRMWLLACRTSCLLLKVRSKNGGSVLVLCPLLPFLGSCQEILSPEGDHEGKE